MLGRIVLAAVTVALAAPAAADAAGVVYWEGGNVFIATPDGSVKRQVTHDGTAAKPDRPAGAGGLVGPYTQASADDAGNVVAARNYRSQDGQSDSPAWVHMTPDGAVLHSNLVSMATCGSAIGSIGPLLATIDASGRFIVFSYFCNYGPPSYSTDQRVAINFPDMQTLPFDDPPDWSGYDNGSFFGRRIVAVETNGVWVQPDNAEAPLTTAGFQGWIPDPAEWDVISFAVNRQGTAAVAVIEASGEKGLLFYDLSGPIGLGGSATPKCVVETGPNPLELSWAPDGSMVAWSDEQGVKVAPAPGGVGGDGACLLPSAPVTLSATGEGAAFTAYTPTPNAVPGGPNGPGQNGPGALSAGLDLPAKIKAAKLAKGVLIDYTASAAGDVTVKGSVAKKVAGKVGVKSAARKLVVARGSTQTAGGSGKVKLRLVKKARKRAKRLKGARMTVALTLETAGDKTTTKETLTLR